MKIIEKKQVNKLDRGVNNRVELEWQGLSRLESR